MTDNCRCLSVFLIVLVFSTSFNQGQKLKANDRRVSGLVPYPRIGRNSEMNFPRLDRAAGLVHYPRVGRSDLPVSSVSRLHDIETDADLDFYNSHDMELESTLEQEYEGYSGRPVSLKHIDKILKDGVWLIPEHVHALKEYRPTQKIDDSKSLYSNVRGTPNNPAQLTINGYPARLGRETDHDIEMSFL